MELVDEKFEEEYSQYLGTHDKYAQVQDTSPIITLDVHEFEKLLSSWVWAVRELKLGEVVEGIHNWADVREDLNVDGHSASIGIESTDEHEWHGHDWRKYQSRCRILDS